MPTRILSEARYDNESQEEASSHNHIWRPGVRFPNEVTNEEVLIESFI